MLMHRRDSLATRCSAAWRLASLTACALVLAAAVSVGGVQSARAQDGPGDDGKSDPFKSSGASASDQKRAEADRTAAEREKLRAMLEANEQELRRAREQLDKAKYDAKRVEDQQDKRQIEVKAAEAQLDALKKQLADTQMHSAADKGKAEEVARKMKEVAKQQAQIAGKQAKLQAEALDLARKQHAGATEKDMLKLQEAKARLKGELSRKWNDTAKHADGADDDQNDEKMMRRLYLDLAGRMPSSEELDDFKKDGRSDKREQLVEKLLAQARESKPESKLDKTKPDKAAWAKVLKDTSASEDSYKRAMSAYGRPEGGAGLKLDAGTLDLVGLATSYADAVGDVRVAEVRVKVAGEASPAERMLEEAAMEKSRHKARLLRSIAEIALRGAADELNRTQQLAKENLVSQSALAEARSKVQILQLIVDTGGGDARGGDTRGAEKGPRR